MSWLIFRAKFPVWCKGILHARNRPTDFSAWLPVGGPAAEKPCELNKSSIQTTAWPRPCLKECPAVVFSIEWFLPCLLQSVNWETHLIRNLSGSLERCWGLGLSVWPVGPKGVHNIYYLKAAIWRKTTKERAPGKVISLGVCAPKENMTTAASSSQRGRAEGRQGAATVCLLMSCSFARCRPTLRCALLLWWFHGRWDPSSVPVLLHCLFFKGRMKSAILLLLLLSFWG